MSLELLLSDAPQSTDITCMDRNPRNSPPLMSDFGFQISLLRLMYPKSDLHPQVSIHTAELERLQEPLRIVPAAKRAS